MQKSEYGGISFLGLLAIVFITLKLTQVIDWSWWYVLMPLWLPIVIFALVGLVMLLVQAVIFWIAQREFKKHLRK
ncbi:hypothetical protein [Chryseobacterium sp.]|uniref:hypothetical protein n=1 Tax=Chryseobacterium sp. TaxID=1871047 RepID=UPI0012AA2E30|nr:hypothetical protein [Chryseobacterium sp.]QFG53665.1 hypothetical protein F7R58_08900 [Chryseobacterium sp.]